MRMPGPCSPTIFYVELNIRHDFVVRPICVGWEGIAYQWVEWLGRSERQLTESLGVRLGSVYRAARRGSRDAERWQQLLE